MLPFDSPVTSINGVGPKKGAQFKNIHIDTVGDLLYHFPRAYQDRGSTSSILEAATSDCKCSMILTVATSPVTARLKNRNTITKFMAFDDTGRVTVCFFNGGNYLHSIFSVGSVFRFYGKLERFKSSLMLSSPEYEPVYEGRPLPAFYPVYPLTGDFTQKYMQKTIGSVLDSVEIEESVDKKYRDRYNLCGRAEAIKKIHRPKVFADLSTAKRYLVFEEFYTFALNILSEKKERNKRTAPVIESRKYVSEFASLLPFDMTDAQIRAINDIAADLESGYAMHRMVSGDVGSGKTVCAAAAAFFAIKNGYQAALMVPTEILARQHYADLAELFEKAGLSVGLLIGSLSQNQKKQLQDRIADGRIDLVIGTHALISDNVCFDRLGVVITDEQHRFGMAQREKLTSRTGLEGTFVHVLAMSATPIPRSLALILYRDMDMSVIDTMPPGRQKVSTFCVDDSYRERMENFIEAQVREGRQVYIVCPSIEDNDDLALDEKLVDLDGEVLDNKSLKSVIRYTDELKERHPSLRIGYLHGKLKPSEKEEVMLDFVNGKLDIIVSTTVIEVGINVPNASLMIVENAERFGLSQLHQLRGRVGRGKYKSWCILVSNSDTEQARARLDTLCRKSSGYEIASADLAQRGPGDFFPSSRGGRRQSGELRFKIANSCDDTELLKCAFDAASDKLGLAKDNNIFAED
ncbi:MAG: ATP-dependent DNA helicase RecG [Clostridia bacterium]|nr:ATP-dependent DNA helicase RecG [Clostridia bacterium]